MEKMFKYLHKDGLTSRLDVAKGNLDKGDTTSIVDVLFAQRNGKYNAKVILEDFGVDTGDRENDELQDEFKSQMKDMEVQLVEFIKTFYNLDGYDLILADGTEDGDVLLYLSKTIEQPKKGKKENKGTK